MIYVLSDLNGCFNAYNKMLDKIGFCDDDILYVLGDVVDYGRHSVKLLEDMMFRPNVYPILGDHERTARKLLRGMTAEGAKTAGADFIQKVQNWLTHGGKALAAAFREMDEDGQESILDYLGEFTLYEVAEVNGKTYLLSHMGIAAPAADDPYALDMTNLPDSPPDFASPNPLPYTQIVGGVPTVRIDEESAGKIWQGNGWIALHCGAAKADWGGKLACLRLDDMKEFYV